MASEKFDSAIRRVGSLLSPLKEAFKAMIEVFVHAYIKYATPYETDPSAGRSGHDQEEDTTYSPRGLRDTEYRTYLFLRCTGLIFGITGIIGAAIIAELMFTSPTTTNLVIGALLVPGAGMSIMVGVAVWTSTSDYTETRRLKS